MAQPCSIGQDLGTTSAKAVAFASDGRVLAAHEQHVTTSQPVPGAAEQDPQAYLVAAHAALRATIGAVASLGYAVTQLGISAAMHSLIALDAADRPLTNALIWLDSRAQDAAEQIWNSPVGQALYARTGAPTHAMLPLAKILWLRAAHPDIFAKARRFVSLKEWLWHAWFGAWEIDPGMAGATGMLNIQTLKWDAEALALAGITPNHLSQIVPATFTRTNAALRDVSGLDAATACVIGSSDGVLANLAFAALDDKRMVLTIGTSGAIRAGSPKPATDSATRMFCYPLDAGHFIIGGPSNSGGKILEWLCVGLLGHTVADIGPLVTAAANAPDPDLLCLPYAGGERAPLWNTRATATFHGLRLEHTPAHLMRAAVEGILFNLNWIAESLLKHIPTPQAVIVSGQVLEPPWIAQMTADILGLPALQDPAADASARGAAQIARIAAGELALGAVWGGGQQHQYLPDPQRHAALAAKYRRFRDLAAALT